MPPSDLVYIGLHTYVWSRSKKFVFILSTFKGNSSLFIFPNAHQSQSKWILWKVGSPSTILFLWSSMRSCRLIWLNILWQILSVVNPIETRAWCGILLTFNLYRLPTHTPNATSSFLFSFMTSIFFEEFNFHVMILYH